MGSEMCIRDSIAVVEPERGGERRTIHRNLLFHCSEELPYAHVETKQKKSEKKVVVQQDVYGKSDDSDESSDDNADIDDVPRRKPPSRTRQKPKVLNYSRLGNPFLNVIHATLHGNSGMTPYKSWLQKLWISGWITDKLIKGHVF